MQRRNVTRRQRPADVKTRRAAYLSRTWLTSDPLWGIRESSPFRRLLFHSIERRREKPFLYKKQWHGAVYQLLEDKPTSRVRRSKSRAAQKELEEHSPANSATRRARFSKDASSLGPLGRPGTGGERRSRRPRSPGEPSRARGRSHEGAAVSVKDTSAESADGDAAPNRRASLRRRKRRSGRRRVNRSSKGKLKGPAGWSSTLVRSKSGVGHKRRTPVLLMRYKRPSLFDIHFLCRVKRSRHGSRRKGRKVKHFSRISTLRVKRLRAVVLSHLSSLKAGSRDLITAVNDTVWPRLRKKLWNTSRADGAGLSGEVMAEESLVSEEAEPRDMTENGPSGGQKSACKAGDSGRTKRKSKPPSDSGAAEKLGARSPPSGEKNRKHPRKSRGGGDAPRRDVGADPAPPLVNGTAGQDAGKPEDMEVEAPHLCADPFNRQLRDHRYCKSLSGREGHGSPQGEEGPSDKPLRSAAVSDEELRELIHDFLEEFFGKYGSFIPLSKSDVLEHLSKVVNKDLAERKAFVYSEVRKYQAGLASAPMHFFKVTYNKHTLTLEDLSTLEGHNWLNDQVINMYGELIMDAVNHKVHFFNSFFHRQLSTKGYEGVKRWTKKVDLFSKSLLLIPIHLEIHWSLITVDIANQNIQFYDSQGIHFKYPVENVLKYILTEAREKKKAIFQKGWKMIVNKCIPQQKNDNDCGVFVLQYCKCLALGKPFHFSQEDMPKVRKRIYKELCECRLID
nr:PREDICTED: sentrin-specific protease 5 isoform X1 [Lepisosteus oculatus]